MPDNTIYVGRGSKWGNPFIVGEHGTRSYCVELFNLLCRGYLCVSVDTLCAEAQQSLVHNIKSNIKELKGKNLACWCRDDGKPCHADTLLVLANNIID